MHGIAQDPNSENLLVATHNGLFTVALNGIVTGPIAGYDFDAMGFAVSGKTLYASGHPGLNTPPELGSPNLGLIRSDDQGESWDSVSLKGTEDFHVLTAGPDGVLYGIGSSSPNIVSSSDGGMTWESRGTVSAVDLAANDSGLYAATEQGLQISTDQGLTFTPVQNAPLTYALAVTPSGTLIGSGTDGNLWSQKSNELWEKLGPISGAVQALGVTAEGKAVMVDDRGVVEVTARDATVISPAQS